MINKTAIAVTLLVTLTLAAAPATATVNVWLDPANTTVEAGQTTQVQLMATFSDPMMGWGIDLTFDDPTSVQLTDVTAASPWNGSESLDHDYLAGLTFPNPVSGTLALATLTFEGLTAGTSAITLSSGPEEDEGFLTATGLLDTNVTYQPATIQVTPEPTSLLLLTLGSLILAHRRK